MVTGNRVERIAAKAGGTGENGNGINVFRAHGVIVANNRIADCAFTSVRANSADNVQITGNSCLRSGEMAIYSEFGFAGALIANNLIAGAASGISVTNFDSGGHIGVVSGNILRDITGKGPYPSGGPTFGVGIGVEADVAVTGNVIDGAGALRHAARLGTVSPRRGGDRQCDPARAGRHRGLRGGRRRLGGDQRQPDLGRRQGRGRRHAAGTRRRPATSP